MQLTIETKETIQASPNTIWKILLDFEAYPSWNPFIKSISGHPAIDEKLVVDLDGMIFKPKVQSVEKSKRFSWLGHLWIKGLFDGEHIFELQSHADGSTTFLHKENFSGLLVGLLKKKLTTDTKASFVAMNEKLKELAESTS